MGVCGKLYIDEYLDHAADKLNKSRGVVVSALLVEDHVAAVTCVRNGRMCHMILQLYPSAVCQITPLTKTKTETLCWPIPSST